MATKKQVCREIQGRIFEAQKDDKGRTRFPVVIISQGLGNLADRHYYSEDAIKSGPESYEGKKCYFDHPTAESERQMPNRSVKETAGHFEDCVAEKDDQGLWALKGFLVPEKNNEKAIGLLEHSVEYKKKYPDRDYVGISINGDGEGEEMQYDEFMKAYSPNKREMEKLSKVEGQTINVITKLTSGFSADLVTEPGARGRVLLEQEKQKRRIKMIDAFKKFFKGLELNKKALIEEAVKDMLNDEGKKEDEMSKEDEAEMKQAEGLAKSLLACKKEMEKKEDEDEAAYEARMMAAAMKKMKQDEAEAKKEDEGKKESDDKDADDAKDEKKDDAKEADPEKKDDEKHDDKDQDVALIKKMMGELEALKKEIGEMKAGKEKAEDEAKQAKESEAAANIKLKVKERTEWIDKALAESGMPRFVTNEIRPVLEKCRTQEEIKETVKKLKEASSKAIESVFYATGASFGEKVVEGEKTSTDHLFT